MATTAASTVDIAGHQIRTTPEKYGAIGDLLNAAASGTNEVGKPDVSDMLVETYGDQGITGFLKLTGAINAAGSSDQWVPVAEARHTWDMLMNGGYRLVISATSEV